MQFNFEVLGTACTRHSATDNAFVFNNERYKKVLSNVKSCLPFTYQEYIALGLCPQWAVSNSYVSK
jgi:hypothetical protein